MLMRPRPPRYTLTDTLFPYTARFRATVMPLEGSRIAASRAAGPPNGMSEAAEIEAIVDKIVEGTEARGVKWAADTAIATPKTDVRAWSRQHFCARGHLDGQGRPPQHSPIQPNTPPPGYVPADPGHIVDSSAPYYPTK